MEQRQPIGQAKLMAGVSTTGTPANQSRRKRLSFFADEKMLIPVLHGIAGKVDALNVTMGFPF